MSDALFPDPPAEFDRAVIIEWPQPQKGGALTCWPVSILDAVTGEPITTVSKMALHFDAESVLWADVIAFTDECGTMLTGAEGRIVPDDAGGVLAGGFRFLVEQMRAKAAADG